MNTLDVMLNPAQPVSKEMVALIKADANPKLIKKNSHDKYGDGSYISVDTVTRILDEAFGHVWSWEIVDYIDKEQYVVCHSRLIVPGVGVRDGIGQAVANKSDNSAVFSSAASYSLKNAARKFGIAPNVFLDGQEYEQLDALDYRTVNQATAQPEPVAQATKPAPQPSAEKEVAASKHEAQARVQEPNSAREKFQELMEAHGLKTKAHFLEFAQVWDPSIEQFEDLTGEVIEALHAYVLENPEEFNDFVPTT